ncbi:DEAD/DEAH box helicase [Mesorhizobium sp. M0142]|uniref:DEAD/DEAH box helicase n=1 Tax=Mesorhizobium sp. M0142 TaxID=2956894 RepID=UPI0033378D31
MLRSKSLPYSSWAATAEPEQSALRLLKRLVVDGQARADDDYVYLDAETVVTLPAKMAFALGFPPIANVTLTLSVEGRIETPDGRIRLVWQDRNLRRTTPTILGPFVTIAGTAGRLTAPVYKLVRAVDAYNHSHGQPGEARITPWLDVQEALASVTGEAVSADGTIQNLRIYQAGAFALDVRETASGPQITPILMSHDMRESLADETDAPELFGNGETPDRSTSQLPDNETNALLTPELQRKFVEEFAKQGGKSRPAVVLGRNTFVVLEPELQIALDVVKAAQKAPASERRNFIANPRAYIARESVDLDTGEEGSVFVETRQYSARVLGLGRWEKPSLDWLTKNSTSWLPEKFVLAVGSHRFDVTNDEVEDLKQEVSRATAAFDDTITFKGEALGTLETIDALESLRDLADSNGVDAGLEGDQSNEPVVEDKDVLLIKTNIESPDFVVGGPPRKAPLFDNFPLHLLRETRPKAHQIEGFAWLLAAWHAGTSGVLLADDMGLGKTFQALSFLAWFRENQRAAGTKGRAFDGPIIIVAPTALLRNWVAEADRHLVVDALGDRLDVFGSGLSRIRSKKNVSWTPEDALNVEQLRAADWILTTYETLATYHRAFARVHYSVGVFDEMQKVKAPDTLNTHALKALNVDFVLGMTGTPIENRLEDLWCIMDRIGPGYLGGLRDFSSRHKDASTETLKQLKAKLDQPEGGRPPMMMRRMKEHILEGLPTKTPYTYREQMPKEQSLAYERAVAAARGGDRSMGAMLKAIHALRGISLHPMGGINVDVYNSEARKSWIGQSARVRKTFEILAEIKRKGEKVLVFIEDRAVQSTFAAAAAAELGLSQEPEIINGEMPGEKRLAVVDRFQALPSGFAMLVLSPKAAGIGLTITAANHVVHLSRWWNPAVEDQCNDRVYRIGQRLAVSVHVPIAIHPALDDASFDVKLDALLTRKRTLSRDMLAPPTSASDVSDLFEGSVEQEP